jgi:peptidyl-prolyl cis-trans isomerase C
MTENKVLATVNDIKITQQDIMGLLQSIGQQRAQQFQSPEGEKTLLNELINQNLFLLDAKERGLDKEKLFLEQIEKIKANVLSQYAVQKKLDNLTVNDEEVKKYYDENKEMFKEQDSIKASHILVDEELNINKILKEVNEGMDFGEAANKYSKCSSQEKGGDLGYFTKGKMVQEFEDVAFSLKMNEVSKPVKTQFGYHIIKLTDRKESKKKEYEEVKTSLTKQVLSMKQNDVYLNTCKTLKDKFTVKIMD